jgi:hypothetical protein
MPPPTPDPQPEPAARVDAFLDTVLHDEQEKLLCRPCEWVQGALIVGLVGLALVFRGWFRLAYTGAQLAAPLVAAGLILAERLRKRRR